MATDITTFIGTGIVIVASLGGAVGYFGKSRGDSIIKYQAIEIANRDDTITRLKEELAATNAKCEATAKELEHYKARNKELVQLSQGSPQLKKLTEAVTALTKIIKDDYRRKA